MGICSKLFNRIRGKPEFISRKRIKHFGQANVHSVSVRFPLRFHIEYSFRPIEIARCNGTYHFYCSKFYYNIIITLIYVIYAYPTVYGYTQRPTRLISATACHRSHFSLLCIPPVVCIPFPRERERNKWTMAKCMAKGSKELTLLYRHLLCCKWLRWKM